MTKSNTPANFGNRAEFFFSIRSCLGVNSSKGFTCHFVLASSSNELGQMELELTVELLF